MFEAEVGRGTLIGLMDGDEVECHSHLGTSFKRRHQVHELLTLAPKYLLLQQRTLKLDGPVDKHLKG